MHYFQRNGARLQCTHTHCTMYEQKGKAIEISSNGQDRPNYELPMKVIISPFICLTRSSTRVQIIMIAVARENIELLYLYRRKFAHFVVFCPLSLVHLFKQFERTARRRWEKRNVYMYTWDEVNCAPNTTERTTTKNKRIVTFGIVNYKLQHRFGAGISRWFVFQ